MSKQTATFIILVPGFAADETDSTCLPAQQLLVKAINKLYPALKIIILAFQYPYSAKEYRWYDNLVIPFNGRNKPKLHRLFLWIKVWRKLVQLKKQNNIAGIFSCWCGECALVGKYFSKAYNLKHFIWVCGQDARKENMLVKYIRPKPGSLIAISDFAAGEFYKNHRIRPAHVILNGIGTGMYKNFTPALIKDIDILGVGSLIPLKQYAVFIKIARQLKNNLPGIKTIICGDGPEKENLRQMINDAGLQQNIMLIGEQPHTEVIYLMQRSKILLHPSSYEGFSGVCLEALYAGMHVISFVRALDTEIMHWHITKDELQMLQKAYGILTGANTDYAPVLVNNMEASAEKLMNLFE